MHKVIHIIHMEKHVDELIYIMERETNVLVIVMKMEKTTKIGKKVLTFLKSKYWRIFTENITIWIVKREFSDNAGRERRGMVPPDKCCVLWFLSRAYLHSRWQTRLSGSDSARKSAASAKEITKPRNLSGSTMPLLSLVVVVGNLLWRTWALRCTEWWEAWVRISWSLLDKIVEIKKEKELRITV